MRRLNDRLRPPLSLVVLAILLSVLALPLAGLFFFRLYENQLVRQTEAELIAQGAVVAAVFADAVGEAGGALRLGPAVAPPTDPALGRYRPVEPRLDLAVDLTLPPRPDSRPGTPDPAFAALGARLSGVLAAVQTSTLAGFRLLDPQGTVIAGGGETGRSLATVPEVRTALAGSYASVLRQRVSDEPPPPLYSISRGTGVRVFVAMPVLAGDRVAGAVYLSRTPSNIVKHLHGERGKVLLAAGSVVFATLLIGFVFLRTVSGPMHELRRRTVRIAAGDASAIAPLARHGTREMAELSEAFLDMARRLQARSDTVRTFATHLSHEMKSPLTAIGGAAELLRDAGNDMTEPQKRRFLDNIVADTQRLSRLVRRLLELAKAESASAGGEAASLRQALDQLDPTPSMTVAIARGASERMRMSAENLGIVLANMADNSQRHGAKHLLLAAERDGTAVVLTVRDDGEGISPCNRARVFEPFFTTRRESGGTGIGLGIVAALLKAHDGAVRLLEVDRGAAFELRLPGA